MVVSMQTYLLTYVANLVPMFSTPPLLFPFFTLFRGVLNLVYSLSAMFLASTMQYPLPNKDKSSMSSSKVPLGDPLSIQHEAGMNGPSGTYSSITSSSARTTGAANGRGAGNGRGSVNWKPSVFDFKSARSGSTCPTCKGSGRIPKGHEDELVALIPYNDKRLKPRRTCLYVSLMAVLLMIGGSMLTAFLYPRSVVVTIVAVNSSRAASNISYWDTPDNQSYDILLGVQTIVGVENSNFYPVTVAMLNVSLMYYENEVGLYYSSPSFAVNSRTARNFSVNQTARFTVPQSAKLHVICIENHLWSPEIFLKISALAQYTYLLGETSTSLGADGKYVNCSAAITAIPAPTYAPFIT